MIRSRRQSRGKSQLHLALDAGISSRHLSFVETGRSNPSREMVVALAEALDVPLRERNAWLEAAGYAALYRETPLAAPSMDEVRAALSYVLDAHGPNPAFAFNRRYDIVMQNAAGRRLLSFFAPSWRGPDNLLEMLLSRDGATSFAVIGAGNGSTGAVSSCSAMSGPIAAKHAATSDCRRIAKPSSGRLIRSATATGRCCFSLGSKNCRKTTPPPCSGCRTSPSDSASRARDLDSKRDFWTSE
jgi:transcriptional regulator with XRE-family HTH domain